VTKEIIININTTRRIPITMLIVDKDDLIVDAVDGLEASTTVGDAVDESLNCSTVGAAIDGLQFGMGVAVDELQIEGSSVDAAVDGLEFSTGAAVDGL
jgi:hypothetical protein